MVFLYNSQIAKDKKIFFIFPSRSLGGVPLLFIRLGEELDNRKLADVFYVDYANGTMANELNYADKSSKILLYDDVELTHIPNDSIVVFQSLRPWQIAASQLRIPSDCKIVFWNCHPFNLVPTFPGVRGIMQNRPSLGRLLLKTLLRYWSTKMISLLDLMLEKNSIFFMDKVNVKTTEFYLDVKVQSPLYLPIPVLNTKYQNSCLQKKNDNEILRFVWVGRIVDFKFYILIHTLSKLDKLSIKLNKNITIKIIGVGDHLGRLKMAVNKFDQVSIEFIDEVMPSSLDRYLIEECDILLAMGTSAIEGAKLGIPTLLLDISYSEVPDGYEYRWLHERDGMSLGEMINFLDNTKGQDSLMKLINEYLNKGEMLSEKSCKYFEDHHAIQNIAISFMKLINNANCYWKDLKSENLIEIGFIYGAFRFIRKFCIKNQEYTDF